MKKLLIGITLLLPTIQHLAAMENPSTTQRHQCSKTCIKGCPIVKGHQSLMVADLKYKLEWGNSLGKKCNSSESFDIAPLFVEKEIPVKVVSLKKVFKLVASNAHLETPEKEESNSNTTEILKPKLMPLSFLACTKGITTLILSGASEIPKLSKPESEEIAINNLDATARSLQIKNDEFGALLKTATALEKEENDYIRLDEKVSDIIKAGESRAQKEPFVTYLDDICHAYTSYLSEVRLLQRRLHPPASQK